MELKKGLTMMCKNGIWVKREKRTKNGPQAPPCEDNVALAANGTCSSKKEHCNQFTIKGKEMDRDCPGTCGQFILKRRIDLNDLNPRFL